MNFEITVDRWAWPGLGMGYYQGKATFLAAVLPGERVLAQTVKAGKNHLEARLVEVLEPSPARIPSPCPHFPDCGGCGLLHLSYEDQLVLKEQQLNEIAQRAGLKVTAGFTPSPQPWGYRHKANLKSGGGKLGLNRYRSAQVLAVPECKVFSAGLKQAFSGLEPNREADLAALESQDTGQVALVWLEKNRQQPLSGFGQQVFEDYGQGRLELTAAGFAQSNPAGTRLILADLLSAARGYGRIAEHYAGAGTLSLGLALGAEQYFGYETHKKAVELGNRNLKAHGVQSGQIRESNAEAALLPDSAQLLVVDPPRAGMASALINKAIHSKLEAVLYLSCDPMTQARDLARLVQEGGFGLVWLKGYDMYAQTGHQEALALLVR